MVVPNRTKNVLSYASTYSASGDQVQTRGTYVKSMGVLVRRDQCSKWAANWNKSTWEIIDLNGSKYYS